ncbi:hypothetical protein ABZX90_26345 [Streptomyces sp. NPDC002935]|uniref:hypothetical protein n=1 Tax=Streptomyces sp. NPDC002935 TaxID=3154545 RepID=UPI0033BCDE17
MADRGLAGARLWGAEALAQEAADFGDTHVLRGLAEVRGAAGDGQAAEALYRKAADFGDIGALRLLAQSQEEAGDSAVG